LIELIDWLIERPDFWQYSVAISIKRQFLLKTFLTSAQYSYS